MAGKTSLGRLFASPVVPVVSDLSNNADLVAAASSVIVQGAKLMELPFLLRDFEGPTFSETSLLVHLDLISGLENNDAALEFLAQFPQVAGVVTIHQPLVAAARKLKLVTVLRVFLSDSRALDRGLHVVSKARPDVVDLLPVAAAVKVADRFVAKKIPFISGGLCRTADDVREALDAGSHAVTSTDPALWKLNQTGL